jgi:hypothetical protein
MFSDLDYVNELLKRGVGDSFRLEHLKKTLESHRILYISDRTYLENLVKEYLIDFKDEKLPTINKYDFSKFQNRLRDNSESNSTPTSKPTQSTAKIPKDVEIKENKSFCTNCGNQMLESVQFCTNCGNSLNLKMDSLTSPQQVSSPREAGRVWYLLPIFLGWAGGIIAWAVIRNRNSKRARNCLIIGVITLIIALIPLLIMIGIIGSASIFPGTSEIDDALSKFPEHIQNIKREQILNCENNMGYLQSHEMGEMIKERCINGILGK